LHNTVWDQQWDKERGNIEDFFGLKPEHYSLLVSEPVAPQLVHEAVRGTLKTQNVVPPLLCLPLLLFYKGKKQVKFSSGSQDHLFCINSCTCKVKNSECMKTNMV